MKGDARGRGAFRTRRAIATRMRVGGDGQTASERPPPDKAALDRFRAQREFNEKLVKF